MPITRQSNAAHRMNTTQQSAPLFVNLLITYTATEKSLMRLYAALHFKELSK